MILTKNLGLFWREEDIVTKGENAGYQKFLLVPQCLIAFFRKVIITQNCDLKKGGRKCFFSHSVFETLHL